MRAYSLAYHDVTDGHHGELLGHKSLYKLTPADFREHVESIYSRNAAVETLEHARKWGQLRPAFLTFDDGELGSYLFVADELERKGWRGHFFITTQWIGKRGFMDSTQIRELRTRGHVIGSHSCTHPSRMSHLHWTELMNEWATSRAILSDILAEPVTVASVPDGFYSRKVGEAAAASGMEVLFTSEATSNVSELSGCMILGRYFIQKHTPAAVSGAIAAGERWPRYRQAAGWNFKKALKAVAGESYLTVRRSVLSTLLRHNG